MLWKKKGLIFKNSGLTGWRDNSALQPTPLVMEDRVRFFVGFRDEAGVSRVGYVDIDKDDPSKVIGISESPVLDVGLEGAFDEFGVVPSSIIRVDDLVYMYYAGYQLGKKVRFLVLSGLAISRDGGETFERFSSVPVFERTEQEMLFRVPHSVICENDVFRFWYGGGSHFSPGKHKTLPVYDVRYLESTDGKDIPKVGKNLIQLKDGEYRIGRPFVFKANQKYYMFYGYSTEDKPYQLGYAESPDGISWNRKDEFIGIALSGEGWDSEMMAYPCVLHIKGKWFLFYNGNNYGADGFGYAELVSFDD